MPRLVNNPMSKPIKDYLETMRDTQLEGIELFIAAPIVVGVVFFMSLVWLFSGWFAALLIHVGNVDARLSQKIKYSASLNSQRSVLFSLKLTQVLLIVLFGIPLFILSWPAFLIPYLNARKD